MACETQAIGRVRRYGQDKKVMLYRFLVEDSIDTQIYEQREAEQFARNNRMEE